MTTTPKNFAVLIPGVAEANLDGGFAAHLSAKEVTWWHWLPNVWIIRDPKRRSIMWWRDEVRTWSGGPGSGIELLVLELGERVAWGGFLKAPGVMWLQQQFGGVVDEYEPPQLPKPRPPK